ncbi:hypothetical protein F4679DRAFT_121819 [Xylaria curta]|nr:hypothetical protein F4679DRAFT_121819 [Xylaria curta]
MDSEYFRRCPIGIKVEHFMGPINQDQIDSGNHEILEVQHSEDIWRWKRGSLNFSRLETLYETNRTRWADFAATLGPQQRSSWSLLYEWVRGAYHPLQLAQAAHQAILGPAPKKRTENSLHPEFPDSSMLDASVYQYQLSELYAAEFLGFDEGEDVYPDLLLDIVEGCRRQAVRLAICQRIAHATYAKIAGPSPFQPPTFPALDTSPGIGPGLWRNDNSGNVDYYPAYLWSISQKKTIDCSHLPTPKPSYVCVSHTWGRWRTSEMVDLAGTPWKIPQNTVFGAQNIPASLECLADSIDTDFVWFDLVCIPQTREGPLGVTAEREIAQQAAIFRGATQCLAWLNYVGSWKAENHLIDWLSLQYLYLSTSPGLYQVEPYLSRYWTLADDNPPQLNRHPSHVRYLGREAFPSSKWVMFWRKLGWKQKARDIAGNLYNGPSAWFSSLWTLQEASVCPYMTLMTRNWIPLRDASGLDITLERLTSLSLVVYMLMRPLVGESSSPYRGHQEHLIPEDIDAALPSSAALLYNLIMDVALPVHSQRSRTEILIQGNRRHCTERRAEAIMSAVGVTDWFDPNSENEKDLVLAMYPIAFVREAARKCGPEFALAYIQHGGSSRGGHSRLENVRGSLLPFCLLDNRQRRGASDIKLYPLVVHETVWNSTFDSWTFQLDGSVRITKAAILGEYAGSNTSVIQPVRVHLCYQGVSGTMNSQDVALHEWLQAQSKDNWIFAVNISREIGIVLRCLRHKGLGSTLTLVKIGAYQIFESVAQPEIGDWIESKELDWVEVKEVDWLVL